MSDKEQPKTWQEKHPHIPKMELTPEMLEALKTPPVIQAGPIEKEIERRRGRNVPAVHRLLIHESLTHQVKGEEPTLIQTRATLILKEGERRFQNMGRAGIQWVKVEKGWVDNPSMLHIANRDKHTILVVGFINDGGDTVTSFASIYPEDGMRFRPADILRLRIASAGPLSVDYITTVYPH